MSQQKDSAGSARLHLTRYHGFCQKLFAPIQASLDWANLQDVVHVLTVDGVSHSTAPLNTRQKPVVRIKSVSFSSVQTLTRFPTHLSSEKPGTCKKGRNKTRFNQYFTSADMKLVREKLCPIPNKQHGEEPEHGQRSLLRPQSYRHS